jgi:hypothetical protein
VPRCPLQVPYVSPRDWIWVSDSRRSGLKFDKWRSPKTELHLITKLIYNLTSQMVCLIPRRHTRWVDDPRAGLVFRRLITWIEKLLTRPKSNTPIQRRTHTHTYRVVFTVDVTGTDCTPLCSK